MNGLQILILILVAGCSSTPVKQTAPSPASMQCKADVDGCVSVTKSFLREHGQLFDENIRLKAALALCEKR